MKICRSSLDHFNYHGIVYAGIVAVAKSEIATRLAGKDCMLIA